MLQRLSMDTSLNEAEQLSQKLEDLCLSVSFFESKSCPKSWRLEALIEENISQEVFSKILNNFKYEITSLDDKDWLAENRKTFAPLIIGPFFIYGSDPNLILPPDKINLKIEASTAFGTGHHESTNGCLLALNALKNENINFEQCLDLGCGTAILALAASRLFSLKGVAVDNDPEAVKRAIFNVQENNLEDSIEVFLSEGLTHPRLKPNSFDLVTANILAEPLIQLSPHIAKVMKTGGIVILSGLLHIQFSDVEKAYKTHNFELKTMINKGEWTTIVLKKSQ